MISAQTTVVDFNAGQEEREFEAEPLSSPQLPPSSSPMHSPLPLSSPIADIHDDNLDVPLAPLDPGSVAGSHLEELAQHEQDSEEWPASQSSSVISVTASRDAIEPTPSSPPLQETTFDRKLDYGPDFVETETLPSSSPISEVDQSFFSSSPLLASSQSSQDCLTSCNAHETTPCTTSSENPNPSLSNASEKGSIAVPCAASESVTCSPAASLPSSLLASLPIPPADHAVSLSSAIVRLLSPAPSLRGCTYDDHNDASTALPSKGAADEEDSSRSNDITTAADALFEVPMNVDDVVPKHTDCFTHEQVTDIAPSLVLHDEAQSTDDLVAPEIQV